jgi:hypothetical protein
LSFRTMFANIFVPEIIPLHQREDNAENVAMKSVLQWEGT